jgi:hypothetical protein
MIVEVPTLIVDAISVLKGRLIGARLTGDSGRQ